MQPNPQAGHRDTGHSYMNVPHVPLKDVSRACPADVPVATTHFCPFLQRDMGGT